ncbi:MAG: fimbrial protein [Rikenellaceae bacterium]
MNNLTFKYLLLYSATLLQLSCYRTSVDEQTPMEGSLILELQLESVAESRTLASQVASNEAYENSVDNLHLLFFESGEDELIRYLSYESVGESSTTFTKKLSLSKSIFTQQQLYDIYIVANLPDDISLSSLSSLTELKALYTQTPFENGASQGYFMMDGVSSVVINDADSSEDVVIEAKLRRALSKVKLSLVIDSGSSVAAAQRAYLAICHYANRTSLIDSSQYVLQSDDYSTSEYFVGDSSSSFILYCYSNHWGESSEDESYLLLNLPYAGRDENYYRCSINSYRGVDDSGCIERNVLYNITLYIDEDGSLSEDSASEIVSNYSIMDWSDKDIIFEGTTQHYLSVSEEQITMINSSSHTLTYLSSMPISITNVSCYATLYDSDVNPYNQSYTASDEEYPLFEIDEMQNAITINSPVPTNYLPRYFDFTVENSGGLSVNISVVQYPPIYLTVRASSGNVKPEWYSGGENLNLFTVNVLASSSDGSYLLGDATYGTPYTDSSQQANELVSPQFIIASQYGIYPSVTYDDAQQRCYDYGEDIYRSGWRLPTKAEMLIIDTIQDDESSAIHNLLSGSAYWTAYKWQYYNFDDNIYVDSSSWGTAYVRPVYDLYKYEGSDE